MTTPRCSFLASPRRNRKRAAGLCANAFTGYLHCCGHDWTTDWSFATQTAIWLRVLPVILELDDVVPDRTAHPMRLHPAVHPAYPVRRPQYTAALLAEVTHAAKNPFRKFQEFPKRDRGCAQWGARCRGGVPEWSWSDFKKKRLGPPAQASSRFPRSGPERTLSAVSFSWLLSSLFLPPSSVLAWAWFFWPVL
jgi:hypothetical protein